jgi:hypothetical protein
MGEARPDWLTKVQIDTLGHNYATNAPKIQQPLLVEDESAKARVSVRTIQLESKSSSTNPPSNTDFWSVLET